MQQLPAFLSVAPVEPEKESIEASRFRMGQYEVKEKLGEEVVKMILDTVIKVSLKSFNRYKLTIFNVSFS